MQAAVRWPEQGEGLSVSALPGPGSGWWVGCLPVVLHEAACTWLRPAGLPEAPPGTQVPSVEGRGVGKFALGHRLGLGWVVA